MLGPAASRLAAVGPGGRMSASGVRHLLDTLARPGMDSVYDTWRNQPFTKMVASAVMDMILSQPSGPDMSVESCAVQYGVTQGLTLAYQMMNDPSTVFPDAFGSRVSTQTGPSETFDSDPDEALQ